MPVVIEQCTVATAVKLKALPVPGRDLPGALPAVSQCTMARNIHIHYGDVTAGSATALTMEVQVIDGRIGRVVAKGTGKSSSKGLFTLMHKQAGKPSKLMQDRDRSIYVWEVRSRIACKAQISYDSKHDTVEAILEPFK